MEVPLKIISNLEYLRTVKERNIVELSREKQVMLVFLRHFGCIFCQEAMRDISKIRREIEDSGTEIILIHMEDNKMAKKYFEKYNLKDIDHISDPECRLYLEFGLVKGSFSQLFGLKTFVRGFSAGFSSKQFGGASLGDAFQMPGVFVIVDGKVQAQYIHKSIADRPDYQKLAGSCKTQLQ